MQVKRTYLFSLFISLFLGCGNLSTIPKPENLIDEALMEQILYEATLLEIMNTFSEKNPNFKQVLGAPYFYLKYGVDSLQLAQSEEYYVKYPKIYQKMHMKVLLRLEKKKDSINKLVKEKEKN